MTPQRNDFFIGAIVAVALGSVAWLLLLIVSLWFLGIL